MLPLAGDPAGPILEGWTLLAALAAQTTRLRLGLMVTGNMARPPAVLAKIAATVDVISHSRLDFGIGVGATDQQGELQHLAVREYDAYGIPMLKPRDGVERLAETCVLVKRMWSETEPFDFDGRQLSLRGVLCEPKPVQRPHPPSLIGAFGERLTLRVVAEHADLWNLPGPPHLGIEDFRRKSRVLDEHCEAIGRDPSEIVRSVQYIVPLDDPATARDTLLELVAAGAGHLVLNVRPAPGVARRVADEIVEPVLAQLGDG